MSAPKHTPGPWVVCEQEDDFGAFTVFPESMLVDEVIAAKDWDRFVVRAGLDHPEFEANARLIAAAPEMLAALNEIAAWGDGEVGPHMDEPGAACIARAAITKATGSAK